MELILNIPGTVSLQLIKDDKTPETTATVTFRILDSTGTIELVSSKTASYNATTQSYTYRINPSADWTTQEIGNYLLIWSISGGTETFPARLTENLIVTSDETKIDKILGLVHSNIYIDNASYDSNDNLVSARLRIYSDSASVGTSSDVLATYQISSTGSGIGKFTTWQQVEV
jgi:hypothetical protein